MGWVQWKAQGSTGELIWGCAAVVWKASNELEGRPGRCMANKILKRSRSGLRKCKMIRKIFVPHMPTLKNLKHVMIKCIMCVNSSRELDKINKRRCSQLALRIHGSMRQISPILLRVTFDFAGSPHTCVRPIETLCFYWHTWSVACVTTWKGISLYPFSNLFKTCIFEINRP